MKPQKLQLTIIRSLCIFLLPSFTYATTSADTCIVPDLCEKAIEIVGVFSDNPFVCIDGCNFGAQPETFDNPCNMGDIPTVWYKLIADGDATLLNIYLSGDEIKNPRISLFTLISDCNNLVPVGLTSSHFECIIGTNYTAEAVGTSIGANIYYIAISASEEGQFQLCVNTVSNASICVLDRNVEIVSRTGDGPLLGPYTPGETVSVCLNVNSYTAAGNGCQWFQGIIPIFGNGWEPAHFDANGQPLNATVNGNAMGAANNGLYGTATWDWFTDVDYHYPHIDIQPYIDADGTYKICNLLYDPNCPDNGGLEPSCCGPCWGTPLGTILPPGWFAYGINGTCPTPGPPIRVDWGDGNTCGGGMGPWAFCFDLKVREFPDCDGDFPLTDLSIGFFTFADGEVGSWTGSASVCALDQPVKLTLPLICNSIVDLGIETLPTLCVGDTFSYEIYHDAVTTWSWDIDPNQALVNAPISGSNGFVFHHAVSDPLLNNEPVTITFHGVAGGDTVYTKVVQFHVSVLQLSVPGLLTFCEKDAAPYTITPVILAGSEPLTYSWWPTGITTPSLILTPPFRPGTHVLDVIDANGCTDQYTINVQVRACHLFPDKPVDDNNDGPIPQDSIDGGNFANNLHFRQDFYKASEKEFKIYPIPSKERIQILLPKEISNEQTWWITDMRGIRIKEVTISHIKGNLFQMDISSLSEGVYFLSFSDGKNILTGKFIRL